MQKELLLTFPKSVTDRREFSSYGKKSVLILGWFFFFFFFFGEGVVDGVNDLVLFWISNGERVGGLDFISPPFV